MFVDPSGRRRWVLRILIGTAVTCVLAYLTLLAIALAGGPVNPSALLPIPDDETPVVITTTAVATTTPELAPGDSTSIRTTTTSENAPTTVTDTTTTTATAKPSQGRRSETPPGASNRPTSVGRG
ncbi:hypothetical protein ALI22I_35735 [Saccharothrix sp. ALI-22-I]|nr:hypothetical protein ALI22I_35735 [Saccharothrix sp. ALI-22-I]